MTAKTNMNPKAQELLEELGFNFKEIAGTNTELDPRIEEAIMEALYEADNAIQAIEDLGDMEATIGHAVIYIINSSLPTLAENVVKDIKNRLWKAKAKADAEEKKIVTV